MLPFFLLKSKRNVLSHQKISGQDRTVADLLKCETFVSILLFVFANDKLIKENKNSNKKINGGIKCNTCISGMSKNEALNNPITSH